MTILSLLLKRKVLAIILVVFCILILYLIKISHPIPGDITTNVSNITPSAPILQTPIPTIYSAATPSVSIAPQQKLLTLLNNRQPLSSTDSLAKKNILLLLPNGAKSGVVYTSSMISIEYVENADLFQGEILSTNVEQAKAQAVAWFREQGVSQVGICHLPISFYLNFQIANQLQSQNDTFNPLPDNC